jgi:hypothetical protein
VIDCRSINVCRCNAEGDAPVAEREDCHLIKPRLKTEVRPSRRVWFTVSATIMLIALAGALTGYMIWRSKASADEAEALRELEEALAETDHLDPRWRWEDLQADRAVVPDDRNSVTTVLAVKQLMPERWPDWEEWSNLEDDTDRERERISDSLSHLEPPQQLCEELYVALYGELERAAPALAEARKLADQPEGRFLLEHAGYDHDSTFNRSAAHIRVVVRMLGVHATLCIQEGNLGEALASYRAALHAARSVRDEPFLSSLLIRIACRSTPCSGAQRVLAQGEPPEDELRKLQEVLEKEDADPILLIALRGERAIVERQLEAYQTGKVKWTARELLLNLEYLDDQSDKAHAIIREMHSQGAAFIPRQRAAHLRYMNRAVEAAKLPWHMRQAAFNDLERASADQPKLDPFAGVALRAFEETTRVSQAYLRCAIGIIAVERYRQAKGKWPAGWNEVVAAGFLRETPTDVSDGKPLRIAREPDGLVIYSVGRDGVDNGGQVTKEPLAQWPADIGFRLWDVDKRRQAAAPLKPGFHQEPSPFP